MMWIVTIVNYNTKSGSTGITLNIGIDNDFVTTRITNSISARWNMF